MRTFGTIDCPDCGKKTVRTSPNTKRCKPCALAAHGETKSGFSERQCIWCGVTYKPTGTHQKACKDCGPAYRATKNREALKARREARGVTPVGTILMCPECGDDFEYRSGPQHRCPSCQRTAEVKRIHEWLASDPDRLKKYADKARDNYDFGGNRAAALERDQHTCQRCGATDDLHVHHIDGNGTTSPREARNNALDNLTTLCRGCHTRVHHEERMRHR